MSTGETLINLRKRVMDAVKFGVLDEKSKDFFEASLIQIMNEAERNRLKCDSLCEQYKRQAAQAEAQSSAYSQLGSIVYAVLNGFVTSAEKAFIINQEQKNNYEKNNLNSDEQEALNNLAKKQESKLEVVTTEYVNTNYDSVKQTAVQNVITQEDKNAFDFVDSNTKTKTSKKISKKPETTAEEELTKIQKQLSKKKKK